MAVSFAALAACGPEVSSQAATPPTVDVSSQDTPNRERPLTRADCRTLPIREDVRACLEEIMATIESETEQIRTETEALRAESEKLDVEIDERLDAFEASVLEDAEASEPD